MGKYGKASLLALERSQQSSVVDPATAWKWAVAQVFPNSQSSQDKGCPKGAFLGLCSHGLVKGVEPGNYTRSKDNRAYAVRAVQLLKQNPSLYERPNDLWSAILAGEEKVENSQTDVVIALWNSGALDTTNV